MKDISERHKYTNEVIDKMRAKGIKPTHLRQYGISGHTMREVQAGRGSFATLIAIERLLDTGIYEERIRSLENDLKETRSELSKYKRMYVLIKKIISDKP